MSFIPDKNLFLVTSAIKPVVNKFYTPEQRFQQTIDTLISIRMRVPEAIIVLSDASFYPLTDDEKIKLQQFCHAFIDFSNHPEIRQLSGSDMKSAAESALLFFSLLELKKQSFMGDVKRIFKMSGRSELNDSFNTNDYDDMFGKYVFKKRIPTWMPNVNNAATDLLITRLYSFCSSLVDNYLQVLRKNYPLLQQMDTEHAHFVNIPKNHLIEFDKVHCTGLLSDNGQIEHY
jgi:hypothetical protein